MILSILVTALLYLLKGDMRRAFTEPDGSMCDVLGGETKTLAD